MRPEKPTKAQLVFEDIMFHHVYSDEYSRLKALAGAYQAKNLTAQWFIMGIRECFRDDNGEDWADDKTSLDLLAKTIVSV